MNITITCTHCWTTYSVIDSLAGKRVRCKKCGETFIATPPLFQDTESDPGASSPLSGLPDLTELAALEPGDSASNLVAYGAAADSTPLHYAPPIETKGPLLSPLMDELVHDKLPPLLLLLGYGLPVGLSFISALRSDSPNLRILTLLVMVGVFLGVIMPITVIGAKMAARWGAFKLSNSPTYRILAAYAAAILIVYLYGNAVSPPVIGPGNLVTAMVALMIWFLGGLVLGLLATFVFLWLFFRLTALQALATWCAAGVAHLLGWVTAFAIVVGCGMLISQTFSSTLRQDVNVSIDASPPPADVPAPAPVLIPFAPTGPLASVPTPAPLAPPIAPAAPKIPGFDPPTVMRAWSATPDVTIDAQQISAHIHLMFDFNPSFIFPAQPSNFVFVNNIAWKWDPNKSKAQLWNLKDDVCVSNMPAIKGLTDAILSPDGNYFVGRKIGGETGGIEYQAWSTHTGKLLRTFNAPPTLNSNSRPIGFVGPHQFLTLGDAFEIWDIDTGTQVRKFADASAIDAARPIVLSPTGKLLAVSSDDYSKVTLYSTETGMLGISAVDSGETASLGSADANSLRFSSDSRELAIDDGARIVVWNVVDGKTAADIRLTPSKADDSHMFSWFPDSQALLASGNEIVDLKSASVIGTLSPLAERIKTADGTFRNQKEQGDRIVVDAGHLLVQWTDPVGKSTTLETMPIDAATIEKARNAALAHRPSPATQSQ